MVDPQEDELRSSKDLEPVFSSRSFLLGKGLLVIDTQEDELESGEDLEPVFSSWNFLLGKGLLVVDSQEDVLLYAYEASELSLVPSCVFSMVEVWDSVNSEPVVPEDDAIVVVVSFLFLEGEVVELILPPFSLNVSFPT